MPTRLTLGLASCGGKFTAAGSTAQVAGTINLNQTSALQYDLPADSVMTMVLP